MSTMKREMSSGAMIIVEFEAYCRKIGEGTCSDLDLEILDTNPELFFHLQQQRLIELIRQGRIEEALEFAQEELALRGEENVGGHFTKIGCAEGGLNLQLRLT